MFIKIGRIEVFAGKTFVERIFKEKVAFYKAADGVEGIFFGYAFVISRVTETKRKKSEQSERHDPNDRLECAVAGDRCNEEGTGQE